MCPTTQPQTAVSAGNADAFKPMQLKMGKLVEVSDKVWAIIRGGKPKADWSGLEQEPEETSPNQKRFPMSSSCQKSHAYRKKGLEDKFVLKTGSLPQLQKEFGALLKELGNDTPAYLQDPDNPKVMWFIVDAFQRYDKPTAERLMKVQYPLYDGYDKESD